MLSNGWESGEWGGAGGGGGAKVLDLDNQRSYQDQSDIHQVREKFDQKCRDRSYR